jgi:citrate synthase/2-methylcitrate synthase
MAAEDIEKGLAGVGLDYTAVSRVNPDTNSLLYRGYPVQELAARCSFEEVAYLLWNGELPTPEQLAENPGTSSGPYSCNIAPKFLR